MKKLLLLIAVVMASASAASAQGWAAGARLGTGFQGVGQYYFANDNYLESRLGLDYDWGGVTADFSMTYNWHCFDWNWTPGNWFFDAGVGLYVGGIPHLARLGAMGVAKLGYTFAKVPVSLSFDWSPSVGVYHVYGNYAGVTGLRHTAFDAWQLCNLGITAVYKF